MKYLLVIIGLCLLASESIGQNRKIEFTEYDLENGLHIILHQDNSTPIVAIGVLYHVGSKNEDSTRTGFAHFFEHLLFEGTENIPRGKFDDYITNAGGTNNAFTSLDITYYHELLPSNQLALGLWLESERMLHAKIEEIGVETQREVVKEERRLRIDNQPYGSIYAELLAHAYTKHPYRWPPIGSMEHLNAASLDEFIAFYKKFYVPSNATLVIAGDIIIEDTKKIVSDYFSTIPKSDHEVPRPNVKEPEQLKEVRDVIYDNIQLPAVIQAYHVPGDGNPDSYALEMLSSILSGGKSSRMYKSLVDDQKIAYVIQSFPISTEDPGLYVVYGLVNKGYDVNEMESAMDKEIERLKTELISEQEYQKIRNQTESSYIQRYSTIGGIAQELAANYTFHGDTNLINTEIEKLLNVTREDIQRVAKKYLQETNRVVLHYLPQQNEKGQDQ